MVAILIAFVIIGFLIVKADNETNCCCSNDNDSPRSTDRETDIEAANGGLVEVQRINGYAVPKPKSLRQVTCGTQTMKGKVIHFVCLLLLFVLIYSIAAMHDMLHSIIIEFHRTYRKKQLADSKYDFF